MTIATAPSLLDALRQFHILEPAQLDEVARDLLPRFAEPRPLAKDLLDRGWLTPYQVNQLFQGRGGNLVLGSYVVLERLGEGGMGQVFKARNWKLGRIVALKVIRKDRLANPEAVRRFQREIRAAAQLSHPNVVACYDADEVGDTLIMVMEYVDAIDLARLLRTQGAQPVDRACDFIRQAAQGLQHALERGMVHRDIKPSNLLLASGGRKPPGDGSEPGDAGPQRTEVIKILDMGLARMAPTFDDSESSAGITREGAVVGTVDYIAPEQAMNSHTVDIRADLYSLGCTFYHLLTGQVPFPGGELLEKLLKQRLEEPAPIEQLRPDVPPGVAAIVRKLMAKKPEDRYQTPAELIVAIDVQRDPSFVPVAAPAAAEAPTLAEGSSVSFLSGPSPATIDAEPPTVSPAYPLRVAAPPLAPRTLYFGLGGAVLLLLSAILAVLLVQAGKQPVPAPGVARPETRPQPVVLTPLDRLRSLPAVNNIRDVVAVLGDHRNPWRQAGERRRHQGAVMAVAYSPDGSSFASAGADDLILVWNTSHPQPRQVFDGERSSFTALAYSPDGKRLVSGSRNGDVRHWDIDAGKELRPIGKHAGAVHGVAFAPDGKHVVSCASDKTARLWEVDTGTLVRSFDGHTETLWCVAVSADGTHVLTGSRDTTARIWDLRTGKELHRLTGHPRCVHGVAFSPDGATCATASCDRSIRLWDVASGKPGKRLQGHTDQVYSVTFNREGTQLLSGGWDRTLRLWDVASARELRRFDGHTELVHSVALSPDGTRAVSGGGGMDKEGRLAPGSDNTVRLWDVDSASELRPYEGNPGPVNGVAFLPNGDKLLSAGADGLLRLWDVVKGQELRKFPGHRNQVVDVRVSRDGKRALSASDDHTLRAWDVDTARPLRLLEGFTLPLAEVALRGDGKRVLAGFDAGLLSYDLDSGQQVGRFTGVKDVLAVCYSADGTRALSGGDDRSVRLWDLDSGAILGRFEGHQKSVHAVALSPDGRWGLSGSSDASARLWNTANDREAPYIDRLANTITGVAFSPDGQFYAVSDLNGRVLVRHLVTKEKIRDWSFPGPVHRITFSPDSRHLATANVNGTVYVLRVVALP